MRPTSINVAKILSHYPFRNGKGVQHSRRQSSLRRNDLEPIHQKPEIIEGSLEIHLQLYSILREKLPSDVKGRAVLQLDEGATFADLLNELGLLRKCFSIFWFAINHCLG